MRPDRIVVGEVRGAEIVDLLAALNTGHEGGCGTLHANRASDVRLLLSACQQWRVGSRSRTANCAALDTVVHLARRRDGSRYVESLAVVERAPDGLVMATPAFEVEYAVRLRSAAGLGSVEPTVTAAPMIELAAVTMAAALFFAFPGRGRSPVEHRWTPRWPHVVEHVMRRGPSLTSVAATAKERSASSTSPLHWPLNSAAARRLTKHGLDCGQILGSVPSLRAC